ncbi:MAG: hypothetical protein HC869_09730, partial [Rhodospirillales bacterium]|nr:hypothetical protein [Rhodospirillales bacterium]
MEFALRNAQVVAISDPAAVAGGSATRDALVHIPIETLDRAKPRSLVQLLEAAETATTACSRPEAATCLHEIFERQADRNPLAPALECA